MTADPQTLGTARRSRAVPSRARGFIAFLFTCTVLAAFGSTELSGRSGIPWRHALALFALLVTAERLMMRVGYRGQIEGITLFEAALAVAIVVLPIPTLVILVALSQGAAALLVRDPFVKASFNVAQWSVASALGAIVFDLLSGGAGFSTGTATALVLAICVVILTNIATFTYVIHLVQQEPILEVLRGLSRVLPVRGVTWIANLSLGIIFAATYAWNPASVVIFFVPLVLLYIASKGYSTAVVDQQRLRGLQRATRALATPVDPRQAIPGFLREVGASFGCDVTDLVIMEDDKRTVHRVIGDSYRVYHEPLAEQTLAAVLAVRRTTTRITANGADPVSTAQLELEGWRDCLAVPLIEGERSLGALCVYNREGHEGFERGEEAVLEALAGEAARAMVKASLLDTILEERQKLADIVGRTSDGILTISPAGTIKTWNAALERITGFRASDMIGSALAGTTLTPRDAEGVAVWLERWAEDETGLPSDIEIRTRAGESRWLSCSYTRVSDADGRPSMLIVVARDATEARELERLKDDFVATVSHELRTPLTPIKGWALTLLQLGDHLSPEQREEGVQAILRHAERLERLITSILEVSKVERGLSDRREAIVDVLAVARKTVDDFQTENGLRELSLQVEGERHFTLGDEVWIEQILTNLLSNAMKYSPADLPIEVGVSQTDGTIEISVTDRGPGIPEHETDRIFERFKRLGDHMTRSQGGTGLGLYIARQLARAIGGELTVRSVAGQGAAFTLRLIAQDETVRAAS